MRAAYWGIATVIAGLSAAGLLACGTGQGNGGDDAAASDGAGMDATTQADGGGPSDADAADIAVYPSPDAPLFSPDGCALLNVPCIADAACCSGYCSLQSVCAMNPKPP
jgi:hypothetical protein